MVASLHDEKTPLAASAGSAYDGATATTGSHRGWTSRNTYLILVALAAGGAAWMLSYLHCSETHHHKYFTQRNHVPPIDVTMSCPNFSPVYPSEGGADCPAKCSNDTQSASTIVRIADINPILDTIFLDVADLISSYGDDATTIVVPPDELHITFAYYCCQTDHELNKRIAPVLLDKLSHWNPVDVSFEYATCAIDGPSKDHVSLILMLDEKSNDMLMKLVEGIEDSIEMEAENTGISTEYAPVLPIRRRRQERFHATLAVVDGSTYPVVDAVTAINDALDRSKISSLPLRLPSPCKDADIFCGP